MRSITNPNVRNDLSNQGKNVTLIYIIYFHFQYEIRLEMIFSNMDIQYFVRHIPTNILCCIIIS
jgi:hypothetical protein